jgi:hypothetical protein
VSAAGLLKRVVKGVAWVAIALLVALGGAGIVATMNRPPGVAARTELTSAGDAAMEPALDAATVELAALAEEVDGLAAVGRRALAQVTAGDAAGLEASIAAGDALLADVGERADRLDAALADVPHTGDDWALSVSADLHERYRQLSGTSDLTDGLESDWTSFTRRTLDAASLSALLALHDEQTAAAAKLGSEGRYRAALDALDPPDATIAASRAVRDRIAASTDVATLTEWLDRNADYDAALRRLYAALLASDGRRTPAVDRAIEAERRARSRLPADTSGLIVIMSDLAQGGLNQAVIAIEEARGSLADALETQQRLRDGVELAPPE